MKCVYIYFYVLHKLTGRGLKEKKRLKASRLTVSDNPNRRTPQTARSGFLISLRGGGGSVGGGGGGGGQAVLKNLILYGMCVDLFYVLHLLHKLTPRGLKEKKKKTVKKVTRLRVSDNSSRRTPQTALSVLSKIGPTQQRITWPRIFTGILR